MNISNTDLLTIGIAFAIGSIIGHALWHLLDRLIWGDRDAGGKGAE